MTVYDYITKHVGEERLKVMIRAGLISINVLQYKDIFECHIANGRSKRKTAMELGMPESTVGYAVAQMDKEINACN